jgi:hypothetical protein
MMTPPLTPFDRAVDSVIGVVAPMLGVITSLQENIEYGLRIVSLFIGIAIGIISLYRLLRKPK